MPASGTPPQPADQAGSTDSTNHRPRRRRRPAVRLVLLTVIAVLLGASQAAPAVHLDPPDLSGLPEGAYVALGDSYASGFGVPPYAEGTDVTGGNTCRRSAGSYAHIVSERTGRTLEMGACSGARTRNFYEANESWGEAAQLDRLGPDTGLVTFSIGGNDAGFARILGDCIGGGDRGFLSAAGCSSDAEVTGAVDGAIDALAGKTTRDGVYSYESIMTDIGTRSPNAAVVAVGYPRLFPEQGGSGGLLLGRCHGVTKVDQRWINAKTDELNTAFKAAALRHGYLFADPTGNSSATSCAAVTARGCSGCSRPDVSTPTPTATAPRPTPLSRPWASPTGPPSRPSSPTSRRRPPMPDPLLRSASPVTANS